MINDPSSPELKGKVIRHDHELMLGLGER